MSLKSKHLLMIAFLRLVYGNTYFFHLHSCAWKVVVIFRDAKNINLLYNKTQKHNFSLKIKTIKNVKNVN